MSEKQKKSQDVDAERLTYYRACMSQFHALGYLDNMEQFSTPRKSDAGQFTDNSEKLSPKPSL